MTFGRPCVQHLNNLLAAPEQEVVVAALQTFQVLVRKTHHTSVRWTPPLGLTQRLLALSKGWGGKDEVWVFNTRVALAGRGRVAGACVHRCNQNSDNPLRCGVPCCVCVAACRASTWWSVRRQTRQRSKG